MPNNPNIGIGTAEIESALESILGHKFSVQPFLDYVSCPPRNKLVWWQQQARYFHAVSPPDIHKCTDTIVLKSSLYGIEPLTLLGTNGIAVRCVDKICRIQNILVHNMVETAAKTDEALSDSIMDLFNYCVLACVILERGHE